MSDPRNAAHDKRVAQEKKHHGTAEAHAEHAAPAEGAGAPAPENPLNQPHPALEGSLTVLTKLKEMEFHSRANLERLAELMITVEDELKQKDFAVTIGDLFAAQDGLQAQLLRLLEAYKAECDRMQTVSD